MKNIKIVFLMIVLAFLEKNSAFAQLKIGYDARNIALPAITLLEMSVNSTATVGKGLILPNITTAQRDAMKTTIGAATNIPGGMVIYNTNSKAIQVYNQDATGTSGSWVTLTPLQSRLVPIIQADLDNTVSYQNSKFQYTINKPSVVGKINSNGNHRIVYNNVTLRQGVEYDVDPLNNTVTFKSNFFPEEFAGFSEFQIDVLY